MGVSILPKLAPMVINVTAAQIRFSIPAISRAKSPKGTKVTRDTSLVMTMLQKKQRKTRHRARPRPLFTRWRSPALSMRNTPICLKPAITVIRQNKRIRVRKSIYPRYSRSGVTKKQETTASTAAAESTVSLLTNSAIRFPTFSLFPPFSVSFSRKNSAWPFFCTYAVFVFTIYYFTTRLMILPGT